jgi:hypothetical protein
VGYAVEGDIRRQLGVYSKGWPRPGAEPPTVADGLALADTAQGTIDAILSGKGVTTPVTAPASFVTSLRDLCAIYAASFISAQLFPQAAGPASTLLNEWLMRQYRAGIEDLRKGDVIPSITTRDATALPRSWATSHPDSNSQDFDGTAGNEIDPVFRRDTKW